jgi:hypothetical protein
MRHSIRSQVAMVVALLAIACSKGASKPTRETILPQLQQEAQSLKASAEKVDPNSKLGVTSTWNIVSVEVKERPKDEAKPFAGTIRFKIESTMKEFDGSTINQQTEKTFEYIYNTTLKQWVIQYKP